MPSPGPFPSHNISMNTLRARRWTAPAAILLLAAVLLVAGFGTRFPPAEPQQAPTPTPGPSFFVPSNPKIGLHTRLTDEPSPENMQREFAMLREMGATWATEFFPWAYIQPSSPQHFDWTHAEQVARAANYAGVTLLARLDGVPAWARPPDTTWRYLDESHYKDYGDFVYAFVSHFKGRISHYIIWNEPNTAAEWGQRKPDPGAYTALLKVAYARAKQADPNCTVLLAGLAPNLEGENSASAMNDLLYLGRLYDAGASPYFDAAAVHAYGLQSPPGDRADPARINFRRAEEIHNVMVSRGDAGKQVYITEGGWNDSARWSYAVKPYQRALYTVEAYRMAENWPWCRAVCLWASRLPTAAHTYFDNYTFITPDFIPKVVYLEVQKYAGGSAPAAGGDRAAP